MPSAASTLLAGRAPALLRCGRRVPRSLPVRAFTSGPALGARNWAASRSQQPGKAFQKRLGTITIARQYSSAAADAQPNPKAYIDSGVIKPQQTVDVKKVLVIGSGGLAIGQAGEFDYSGMFFSVPLDHLLALTASNRLPGPQGPQGGRSRVRPHQPQHCHHSDQPHSRRRGLLPARHPRVRHICHREGEARWHLPVLRRSDRPQPRCPDAAPGPVREVRRQGSRH